MRAWLSLIRRAWFSIQRSSASSDDLRRELDAHAQLHADAGVQAGLTPEHARRAALLRLGGPAVAEDQLSGMVMVAVGVGLGIFLQGIAPGKPIYRLALVPGLVGLVLLLQAGRARN